MRWEYHLVVWLKAMPTKQVNCRGVWDFSTSDDPEKSFDALIISLIEKHGELESIQMNMIPERV